VTSDSRPRKYDLPWVVLDASRAQSVWGWQPEMTTSQILEEIADHAGAHPDWLNVSAPD
jgi:CDP-paratose 2-epimerase